MRRAGSLILGGVAVLGAACATKGFVEKQVSATESKLTEQMTTTQTNLTQQLTATKTDLAKQMTSTQSALTERADLQEAKLREAADRAAENRQAVDSADQRLRGLDTLVGEVGAVAKEAKSQADLATTATHGAEVRLAQRLAGRNKYRLLDTRSVYFASGQIEIRSQDVAVLEEVAKALTADPNAILELQGFADSQGSDRYNRELARERVEAVMRHLVQRHGIELRQLQALSMGKVPLAASEKATAEVLARARRVDLRLLSPWASWEDAQATVEQTDLQPATTIAGLPDRPEPSQLPQPALADGPARRRLPEFLWTLTPKDLGGD